MESDRVRGVAYIATATGDDHQLVVGVGSEAPYGAGIAVYILGGNRPDVETRLTDIYQPCVGISGGVPDGIHAVECGACHANMLRRGTGGCHPKRDIVEGVFLKIKQA